MSEWDEIQRRNWGGEAHNLPDYLQLLKSAIEQAVGTQRDVHVKITMQDANVSLSVEITMNPSCSPQSPQLPQIIEQLPDDVVIMGDEDE